MKLLVFIYFVIISCNAFGQFENAKYPVYVDKSFKLRTDTVYKNIHVLTDHTIDSIFNLNKQYDFELRFWRDGTETNSKRLFVLSHKNNTWNARFFISQPAKPFWKEVTTDQTKLDQLWFYLKTNNLLTLPSQQQLESKTIIYQIDTVHLGTMTLASTVVTDGILYSFELSTPDKRRFYSYGSPQTLHKIYPNILELANATAIVWIIHRYLKLPPD